MDPSDLCRGEDFCRLGCVCQSISGGRNNYGLDEQPCYHLECMLGQQCQNRELRKLKCATLDPAIYKKKDRLRPRIRTSLGVEIPRMQISFQDSDEAAERSQRQQRKSEDLTRIKISDSKTRAPSPHFSSGNETATTKPASPSLEKIWKNVRGSINIPSRRIMPLINSKTAILFQGHLPLWGPPGIVLFYLGSSSEYLNLPAISKTQAWLLLSSQQVSICFPGSRDWTTTYILSKKFLSLLQQRSRQKNSGTWKKLKNFGSGNRLRVICFPQLKSNFFIGPYTWIDSDVNSVQEIIDID